MLSLRKLIVTFIVITKVFLPSCSCSSKGLCEVNDEDLGGSLNRYADCHWEVPCVPHVVETDLPDKLKPEENTAGAGLCEGDEENLGDSLNRYAICDWEDACVPHMVETDLPKHVENNVEANQEPSETRTIPDEFGCEPEAVIAPDYPHPVIISELPSSHPLKSTLIGGRWILLDTLDEGCFGDVYTGVDRITARKVAVKVEKSMHMSTLSTEYKLYQRLLRHDGFVTAHHCERLSSPPVTVLVMDLMGPSLAKLLHSSPGRKFSLKTVLMLAVQMIDRLEALHQRHYIHRDIKPENFVVGLGDSQDKIYLIDFGLAKLYRDPQNPESHIPMRVCLPFSGTYRHASLNSHRGMEQSRRDDLESLGYNLVYLLNGSLPWHWSPGPNLNLKTYDVKSRVSVDQLCYNCPREFGIYFHYVKNLKFSQTPDYLYMKDLFNLASTSCGLDGHAPFDWMKPEESSSKAP